MKKNWFRAVVLSTLVLTLLLAACAKPAEPYRENATTNESVAEEVVSEYAPAEEISAEEALQALTAPRDEKDEAGSYSYDSVEELSAPRATQAADPYEDNFFENYGVNPMIDTEDDNLSTFAIDVDTGSYTLARRNLLDGYLPDEDSVRVEEFVNYFDQGYAQPEDRQSFTINLDGGPAPFTQTERYSIIRVGLQGYEVPQEDRKDVSLTFVIDVSGSMGMDNRLGLVKRSLELLVDQLHRDDQVSIVVYGTRARVVLEPTSGREYDEIMDAIDSLEPEGSTNAEAGIKLGYKMALKAFNPEGINRVILCSDGVANVGNTGAGSIWEQVEDYASEGITLTTMGFGMDNYNDVLMEQFADMGDGFYAYIDTIDEAERLFVDNLTSTLQTIAKDAKVQVEFNPEVVSRYRLIGFENRDIADEDFRDDSVDAGEIGAGHSVTALYEVKLFGDAAGEIANVILRWQDPETGQVTEINRVIRTEDLYDEFDEADPYYQWDVLTAEFAEVLRDSYWAEDVDLDDLLEEFDRLYGWFERDNDRDELIEMVETAAWLLD
ncbi:MAG: von Willebrand factor type A domain-containing protein [Anaerolineae bacterium]|nr:von Willebrand factor type A domain-containing protein [Anaerolineae bacterium]